MNRSLFLCFNNYSWKLWEGMIAGPAKDAKVFIWAKVWMVSFSLSLKFARYSGRGSFECSYCLLIVGACKITPSVCYFLANKAVRSLLLVSSLNPSPSSYFRAWKKTLSWLTLVLSS